MIARILLALAAAMSIGSNASAGAPSGAVLYKYCRDPHSFVNGNWNMGFCSGYINGMINALQLTGTICMAAGTHWGTADNLVIAYLSRHPELRDEPGAPLVVTALMDAFPCQTQKSKSN